MLVALIFVGFVRLRLAPVPLERDEGEYAYAGQLILQGIPPYQLAYNMKFPGTYYAYAAILAVFGESPWGIHVGLAIVNAATVLLVFALGRRLLGDGPAAVAAVSFALLTLDRWIMGVFAHATHFVLLPALGGLLVVLRALDSGRRASFLGGGLLLGTAVLMKQHALLFLPLAAGLVVWSAMRPQPRELRSAVTRLGWLAAGSILPLALVAAVFLWQGVLGRFWFWTFHYAIEYSTELPLSRALPRLAATWTTITRASLAFWLIAAAGLVALAFGRWEPRTKAVLTGLLAASGLAMCPGFYFRPHYFILFLPALALLVGVAAAAAGRLLAKATSARVAHVVASVLFALVAGYYVVAERSYLFSMNPRDLSRMRYGGNPFIEAVEIARYIRERTPPGERIAVVGSEPEIYFYAQRKSATGYMYTYALMEPQRYASRMQDEMMEQIEAAHPRYLVFAQIKSSWAADPSSDRRILDWVERYARKCYYRVGIADIFSEDKTAFVWDLNVRDYRPLSENLVFTFRRRSEAPCTAEAQ